MNRALRRTNERTGSWESVNWTVAVTPSEKGEPLNWEEWRKVTIEYGGQSHDYRVRKSHESAAEMHIEMERAKHEHLAENVKAGIVNAVSMNSMPVIRWD